jgi:hypothetical protein
MEFQYTTRTQEALQKAHGPGPWNPSPSPST